jgi:hypothetical protein
MEEITGRTMAKRKQLNRILLFVFVLWIATGLLCMAAMNPKSDPAPQWAHRQDFAV